MAQHHASTVPSVPPQALQRFQPSIALDGELSQLAAAGGNAHGPAQLLQQRPLNRPQNSLAADLPLSRVAADCALAAVREGHRLWKKEAASWEEMTLTAHQCPAKIAHTGCSMAVQGCLRLSLEAFNGCASKEVSRAERAAEDALTSFLHEGAVSVARPKALYREGLYQNRLYKSYSLSTSARPMRWIMILLKTKLLTPKIVRVLGPGARHDALALLLVLVVVEAHGVELGAQADLLVDSAGQALHAETAQLAGPLDSDAALLGRKHGAGLADGVLGEVEKAGPAPRLLVWLWRGRAAAGPCPRGSGGGRGRCL